MIRRTTPLFVALAALVAVWGCGRPSTDDTDDPAAAVLASAIEYQGGALLDRVQIDFDFRDRHYRLFRKDGLFQYERLFQDSTGQIRDVVNNDDIYREVNGERVVLDSVKHRSLYVDVNSIAYFALLPHPLGDDAVRSKYLGTSVIDSVEYHEVEVTFANVGGGLDYQDRFVYWIRPDPAVIDYMAYYYYTDGGGSRFRKSYNQRRVGDILFADYLNYSAPVDSLFTGVHLYDNFYMSDSLTLVSEINLENVAVTAVVD